MTSRHCQHCGAVLAALTFEDGRKREQCLACGTVAWRNPTPVGMALIEHEGRLVLIRRLADPLAGYWAPPAGYVELGESVAQAVLREAKEETGLDVTITELFHCYSDPARDPRQHTVTAVFLARAAGVPVGGDDAAEAIVAGEDDLPAPLCFDHGTVVADYYRYRRTGERPPPRR